MNKNEKKNRLTRSSVSNGYRFKYQLKKQIAITEEKNPTRLLQTRKTKEQNASARVVEQSACNLAAPCKVKRNTKIGALKLVQWMRGSCVSLTRM